MLFVFAFNLVVSPLITLLVMGYGNNDPPLFFDVILNLRKQIESEKYALEKVKDPVAIDYWLAKQSKIFAIENIDVVALSLTNHTLKEVGGGVIGSPFEKLQPAQSQMEFIAKDICIVAFPESPGLALIGIDKHQGENFIKTLNKLDMEKYNICKLLGLAEKTAAKAAMVILDGCGLNEAGGGFFIKEMNLKKTYYVSTGRVSGECWLELYMC